jgi:hypothetical protein
MPYRATRGSYITILGSSCCGKNTPAENASPALRAGQRPHRPLWGGHRNVTCARCGGASAISSSSRPLSPTGPWRKTSPRCRISWLGPVEDRRSGWIARWPWWPGPGELKNRYPRQHSGGSSSAFGLVPRYGRDPKIKLIESPGAIDSITREKLQDELPAQGPGKTFLFVTHDIRRLQAGDRGSS